jgi:hypothetical protein
LGSPQYDHKETPVVSHGQCNISSDELEPCGPITFFNAMIKTQGANRDSVIEKYCKGEDINDNEITGFSLAAF